MDRTAIRKRRRILLTVAGALLGVGLVIAVLFGRRWRQEIVLKAFGSTNDAKAAWAVTRLKEQPDKGVGLLVAHLGRRGEHFDLRVADYLESIDEARVLPVDLRVRAAVRNLTHPVLGPVALARLLELPADALDPLLAHAVGLEGLPLHRAALACARLNPGASRERATELLDSDSAPSRRLGLAVLGAVGGEESLLSLRSALADHDASVRAEAVHDVALVGGRQVLPELVPFLADPEASVRAEVLAVASTVGRPEDGALLLPALDDEVEDVRAQAVLALAALNARDQVETVIGLATDPSPEVREAVAAALGTWYDDDHALAALLRIANDSSPAVVRVAYRGLVESRRRDILPFFISELTNEGPSWAADLITGEPDGDEAERVPLGAFAACALRWLTGREFGYDWRATIEAKREVQQRWQDWLTASGNQSDLTHAPQPTGMTTYEQLLQHVASPPETAAGRR